MILTTGSHGETYGGVLEACISILQVQGVPNLVFPLPLLGGPGRTEWYFTLGWISTLLKKTLFDLLTFCFTLSQGGRTWQPFVGSKNGNENIRQVRVYNFRVKCVSVAHNRKFAKLTQWNMQHIPCNSALLTQETLFLTQKGIFLPKDLQKVRKSRQILIRDKIAYVRA